MAELHALVLAAGRSVRFGAAKLLQPWRGGRLIEGALGAALSAPVAGVVVVTGEEAEVGRAALRFAASQGASDRLRLTASEDPGEGVAASLRAGVRALPASAEGALVLLGDMPLIPAGLAGRVAAALEGEVLAAAPWREGRPGHPVGLRRALFTAVLEIAGDRGAGPLLARLGDRFARLDTDEPWAFADVDDPADLARLQG